MTAVVETAGTVEVVVPASVRLARTLLPAELHRWVSRFDPDLASVCGYQLALYDAVGRPASSSSGKLIRPALAFASATACGAAPVAALAPAVAVELMHNASLVHDDVMDGDEQRRHRQTVWKRYGVSQAILAGDALIGLAFEALTEPPVGVTVGGAAHDLAGAVRALAIGQGEDLRCEGEPATSTRQCLELMAGKTGALLGVACRLGARFAGAPARVLDRFERFGSHLGIAFQLVDDLLGIWGDPAVTGKPVGSDLQSRKCSGPVVAALANGGVPADRLRALYESDVPLTDIDVLVATDLVEAGGGRDWATTECARQLAHAWRQLAEIDLEPGALAELKALSTYVVSRVS